MDDVKKILENKTNRRVIEFLMVLILFAPLFYVVKNLYLSFAPVWSDEAVYMDTIQRLMDTGNLSTGIFGESIYKLNEASLWYPPLFFYVSSWWMKVFGVNLVSFRAMSVVFGFFSIFLMYLLSKKILNNRLLAFLATFMMSVDFFFLKSVTTARMDAMNFFLLLLALFIYVSKIKDKKRLVLAGVVSGLSVVTHPLGVVLVVILALNEIFKNKKIIWQKMVWLLSPVFGFGLVWLLWVGEKLPIMIRQYQLQVDRKAPFSPYIWEFLKVNTEFKIVTLVTIVFLVYLISNRFIESKKSVFLVMSLVVFVSAITYGKELWYIVYLYPFMPLVVMYGLNKLRKDKNSQKKKFFGLLAFIMLVALLNTFRMEISLANNRRFNYLNYSKKISESIDNGKRVFLSATPDPYFYLKENRDDLIFYEFPTVPVSKESYFELLDSVDVLVVGRMPEYGAEYLNEYVQEYMDKEETLIVNGQKLQIVELVDRDKDV